jgi:hypothetical protein
MDIKMIMTNNLHIPGSLWPCSIGAMLLFILEVDSAKKTCEKEISVFKNRAYNAMIKAFAATKLVNYRE